MHQAWRARFYVSAAHARWCLLPLMIDKMPLSGMEATPSAAPWP